MAGEGFKETLTKKAGPLPVWAWAGLGVVIVAVFMIQRNKKAEASAAAEAAVEDQSGGVPATNLGSNSLSNLVPQAYPMPFQLGDIFVNGNPTVDVDPVTPAKPDPTPAKPTPTPAKPVVKPAAAPVAYVIAKGDTFDSIGKKLNIAPTTLWALTGMTPGKKVPAVGTQINIRGIAGNPDYSYANESKIVSALNSLSKTQPKAPAPGTVLKG